MNPLLESAAEDAERQARGALTHAVAALALGITYSKKWPRWWWRRRADRHLDRAAQHAAHAAAFYAVAATLRTAP